MSVITPAWPLKTLLFGFCRLARLKALKTSHRNMRLKRSVMWKFLSKPQSAVNKPGPRSELREAFPKLNVGGAPGGFGFGFATEAGLYQQLMDLTDDPVAHVPLKGLPIRFGRRVISNVLSVVLSIVGENG